MTATEINKWLVSRGLRKRSRNNERAILITFSVWARNNRYLPLGLPVPVSEIKKLNAPTTISISPIAAVTILLAEIQKQNSELLPYAACGLFAGVRPKELLRLRFEEAFRWAHNDIEIRANQAKTGMRRLTKIQDNLKA